MLNVDGWTDGQTNEWTNGRKLADLCLPAKAGATKIHKRLYKLFIIINIITFCVDMRFEIRHKLL